MVDSASSAKRFRVTAKVSTMARGTGEADRFLCHNNGTWGLSQPEVLGRSWLENWEVTFLPGVGRDIVPVKDWDKRRLLSYVQALGEGGN